MIADNQVISIEQAKQLDDYKLQLVFNDQSSQVVDFQPFLSQSLNPLIRKYLVPEEFAKFEIDEGDLQWNDYDLCFPIADLYENRI
ncbi:MAG: DUF2442 domain-containing protein [Methylococcaceae bacterium]|nr:DUF2442 domain-containing protein [Methylococcaceae bacterium]